MASASGKVKDGGVTEYQLKVVEYELMRSRNLEENERRMAVVRDKSTAVQQDMEANRTPKKKRKAPSHALVSMNEGRVLRSSVTKEHDHLDPAHQPSKSMRKGGDLLLTVLNAVAPIDSPPPPLSHTPIGEFFLIASVSLSCPSNPSYTDMQLHLIVEF